MIYCSHGAGIYAVESINMLQATLAVYQSSTPERRAWMGDLRNFKLRCGAEGVPSPGTRRLDARRQGEPHQGRFDIGYIILNRGKSILVFLAILALFLSVDQPLSGELAFGSDSLTPPHWLWRL